MTTPYVRPDLQQFLDIVAMVGRPPMHEGTAEQAREGMRASAAIGEAEPPIVRRVEDFTCPGPRRPIGLRLYDDRTAPEGESPLILFFHGGGFVIGDLDIYDSVAREFAVQTGYPVLSVDYGLAPEEPFPAAPDDCVAAARWAADSPDILGFTVMGLALTGDSAGGNLTIVTALDVRDSPAAVPLLAIAPMYPLVDDSNDLPSMVRFAEGFLLTAADMRWFGRQYGCRGGEPRHHVIDRDLTGLPPTLLMTAALDPLHDQGALFVKVLRAFNVPVEHHEAEGLIHGFITLRKMIPSGQEDLKAFLSRFKALIGAQAKP
jgi:acetyl esterase